MSADYKPVSWGKPLCLVCLSQMLVMRWDILCPSICEWHVAAFMTMQDAFKSQTASVLEFDLYHAEPLLPLSDDAIIKHLVSTYLAPTLPGGAAAAATLGFKDASVLRFRKAVTRFSPGSHDQLPGITTSIPNLYVAGDCVRQGPGTHGCKGLSQEKAYVTGLEVRPWASDAAVAAVLGVASWLCINLRLNCPQLKNSNLLFG